MNNNLFKHIICGLCIGCGTVAALATFTSCREVNDWESDSSTARLFSVNGNKITVVAEDTYAEITFTAVPDVSYYLIEVSKDSLYDEVEMGSTPSSIVFGQDKSITKSPVNISNLGGNSRYFLRIKAMSETKKESKWSYLTKSNEVSTFKTKAEQIFMETVPSDRDEDRIRVAWDATKAVTKLVVSSGDDTKEIVLDDAAKAAGEYWITGLKASTTYTIKIMNGNDVRGTLNVSTTAAMPAADYKKTLTADETLISPDMLNELAAQAAADGKTQYGVTIAIPAGAAINFHGLSEEGNNTNVVLPDGMSITFFGLPGEKPTIKFQKNLDVKGSHGYVTFNNVNVVDNGAGYFINQGDNECMVGEFSVIDCEISGFGTSFFRLQKAAAKNIEKLVLKNSIFHDMCSGYSFLHIDAEKGKGGGVKNIEIDGCTLYNIATGGKMFVYSRETPMESLVVKNTTFYNCIGNNNYWVDFGNASTGTSGEFSFTDCLFTKTPDDVTKNIRSSNDAVVVGCYHTTDFFKTIKGSEALDVSSDELFVDPANADFHFKPGKELRVGDPRWFSED